MQSDSPPSFEYSCAQAIEDVAPRHDDTRKPKRVKLKAVISAGDNGEPVITLMLPDED